MGYVIVSAVLFAIVFCLSPRKLRSQARAALLLVLAASGALSYAQTTIPVVSLVPTIRSFAGGGSGGDNVAATASLIAAPAGTAIDSSGNVYIADLGYNKVRLVSAATGLITTVAGTGAASYSGDNGPATSANIHGPGGIALDPFGNLYIADMYNNVIRKVVLSTGIITTVAGTGTAGYGGDGGLATAAMLNEPRSVASDSAGRIYFSDSNNNRVRLLSGGIITTVAGTGVAGFSGDNGPAAKAQFWSPLGVQLDPAGNLYIADYDNHRIREIAAGTQIVTTIAGNGTGGYSGDGGPATSAELNYPIEAFPDAQGNLYISDSSNNRIRKISAGTITTFAGTGTAGYQGDGGPATSAELNFPVSIIEDSFGTLYIADLSSSRVRTISALTGSILFPQISVGSAGLTQNIVMELNTAASISSIAPQVSAGGKQEFTVTKTSGCTVNGSTKIAAGTVCTIAVDFTPGYAGARGVPLQVATSAGNAVFGLAGTGGGPQVAMLPGIMHNVPVSQTAIKLSGTVIDNAGNVYVSAPAYNEVLRVAASNGAVAVFAGNGTAAWQGDGHAAASASLNAPAGLALDAAGDLFIADEGNNRVRRVDGGTGIITTIAGSGTGVSSGDGGTALAAGLNSPAAVVLDTAGNLYIAEKGGNRVRRVLSGTNIISTYAGGSSSGFNGDGGPASQAQLNMPVGLAIDASGNIYIADSGNNCIRKVAGSSAYISTVAGGGSSGGDGGPATAASLLHPVGVAVDGAADFYIAESNSNRVRMVSSSSGVITTIAGNGQGGASIDGTSAVATPVDQPVGVAIDPLGNPYIVNDLGLLRVDASSTAPLSFITTPVGASSSPQDVTLANVGNAALGFPTPSSGSNPAVSTNFTVDGTAQGACPQTVAGQAAAAKLPAGSSCVLAVHFAPTTTGSLQGNAVISDTSLNASGALQTLSMIGSGSSAQVGLVLTAPASATYGNAVQVMASVTDDATQGPAGGGTVGFSDQSGSFGSQAVQSGIAKQSFLAPSVGTFTLTGNYTPPNGSLNSTSGQTTIQITAAPLNLLANSTTRSYGAVNPQFTGSINGAVNGDTFTESFKTSAAASSAPGSYSIVPSAVGANLSNYAQSVQDGTLQVTPANLTVAANNATRTYGATNPAFTGSVTGTVNGDALTESFTTNATTASPVAAYSIVPSVSGPAAANYNPTIQNGTLSVTPAGLTVSANSATRTYGAANPAFTGSIAGAVNGDSFTETFTTAATPASSVATYPIVPAAKGPALSNYTSTINNGTLTVTPATLAVKANDATRTYGAANPSFAGAITGAVNGDSFTESFTTSATQASPVATYPIVPSAAGQNLGNYTQSATNGTLTVTPATLAVKANDATRTYGAANPSFAGAITGAVNGDSFTESFTTSATQASQVATYPIVPSAAGQNLGNYTSTINNGTLTVTPATLAVKANDATRTYGAANPSFAGAITGAVNGDSFTESFTTSATQASSVATYPIVPSAAGQNLGNYTSTINNGTLTVTPATLAVKANDATRTYGAANPSFAGAITGAVNGDSFTESFTTSAAQASPVATYPIVPSAAGANLGNYTQSATNGTLTVAPATLAVKANDATRTYGAANPSFAGAITGAVNGDSFTESFTTSAAQASPVATYPIVPSAVGANLGNYTQSATNGTLTVTPATLAVKANDATRTYGAANPSFAGAITGAVNGDSFTESFTTSAAQASPVATYPIVPSAVGANLGNYTQSATNGTLTITPATLAVKANDATRTYGAANPSFAGAITGAVNGDSFTESFTTGATQGSPVATYPIVPSAAGQNLGNYTQSATNGTLTITPATLAVKANDATRTYGAANPSFAGAITGAVNGDSFTESFTTSATQASSVATYPIVPSAAGQNLGNYTQSATNGTLTVTPATLAVKANDATRTYGAANPSFAGAITGAVNGDSFTESFTTSAAQASPVATYPIVPSAAGANLGNYTSTINNGTLTVTPATLAVKANDATRTYGAANPSFAGAITGAVNGDSFTESFTTSATQASPVATYPIVPSAAGQNLGNYTQSATNSTLTVTPATLAVSADDITRAYGSQNPPFTGTIQGAVAGDSFQESFATDAAASSPVGNYSVVPSVSGIALANYTQTMHNGTLTITPASLRLSANDAIRPYGVANPVFAGAITGLLGSDTLTEQFGTPATIASAPGAYTIVPSAQGAAAANYQVTASNGTLTITAAPLTASAANASRMYGAPNPSFTGAITGAANGEVFTETFSTSASAQSPLGSYPVVPAVAGATLAYYTPTLVPGTLSIIPAPLTVAPANLTRTYGAPNPTLTGTVTGAVNNDVLQASFTTTATASDAPGTYPILASLSGSALTNYTVQTTAAMLTITQAATTTTLTRTAAPATNDGSITLQAQVQPATTGTPSGMVHFLNGATELGVVALQNGMATFATNQLQEGQLNALMAVYQGDVNFRPSSSSAMPVELTTSGFWVKPAAGPATVTIQSGEKASFSMQVGPGSAGFYPGEVTFSVTGLPAGATATFSPQTLAPESGEQTVLLSVQTQAAPMPASTARNSSARQVLAGLGEAALALLLLPLAGARRLRRAGKGLLLTLLLVLGGLVGGSALTGCGFTPGSSWSGNTKPAPQQSTPYTLTVTMTSGGTSQTTTATLVLQR